MDSQPDTDEGRWLTYSQIATLRGISKASAERLVRRHKWRRQADNQGFVRAFVPLTWTESPEANPPDGQPDTGADVPPDITPVIPALREAISALTVRAERAETAADRLTAELQEERARADRAEQRADNERVRVEQAEEQIGDLRRKLDAAATDLTAAKARGDRLGGELDQMRTSLIEAEAWMQRPWWRRLRRKNRP